MSDEMLNITTILEAIKNQNNAVDQLAAHATQAVNEATRNATQAIDEVKTTARNSAKAADAHIQGTANNALTAIHEAGQNTATNTVQAITDALAPVMQAINSSIQRAEQATETLMATKAAAEQAKAEQAELVTKNQELLDTIEAAKAKHEKALALLKMATENEVNRMLSDMKLKAEEKRYRDELKARQQEVEDEFDRTNEFVTSGLIAYYPELQAKLDAAKASAEADNEDN